LRGGKGKEGVEDREGGRGERRGKGREGKREGRGKGPSPPRKKSWRRHCVLLVIRLSCLLQNTNSGLNIT